MVSTRTYGQVCAAASALDLVGERWALLLVRELLLGPKRFTELRAGMSDASPNVLSQRLRELEEVGVVRHRKLGPPAAVWVYELTEWGQALEPVLIELARWGRRSPFRNLNGKASVDALMLALRAYFSSGASAGLNATYALRMSGDRFMVRVADRRITVVRGDAVEPDAVIETDLKTFGALLAGSQSVDETAGDGRLKLSGDAGSVERLLAAIQPPDPAVEDLAS